MTSFRAIFEDDWCGIEKFLTEVLVPIFGEYQKGYDILTKDAEVKKRASLANITEIKHAATFDLIGSEIKVFDISVSDKKRLAQSRVGIQQVVRQYINQFEGALIVFHHENVKNQEWRLSYVEKRTGVKDTTSAKRYTYILGKEYHARTITERFNSLLEKKNKGLLLKDLTDAFSVEPLSDEFFDKYREHYADLVEYISGKRYVKKGGKFVEIKVSRANAMFKEVFNQDDKEVRDFVKKMMGRLVFLQFLQKKGWLGVDINGDWGSGDKNFLYNLFQNASEDVKKDFLETALNPLFFKTLNTDRGDESVAPKAVCDVYGKKVRIPYLNGGLFEEEPIDKKHVKFRKEDFDKLFNFFTEYNFTIDESDPVDVEIGVDPEMLGKIFENLLEDNKDKGAFYTPKEIVQYMCRESLIAYLSNCHTDSKLLRNFSDTEDRIRQFVLKQETNLFSDDEKKVLLKALRKVKVCDPAVGSGAFPMGLLNELYGCRISLGENEETAEIKKQIVRENIYGVDIEKGAVDIARLRFWLSIIVDEKEPIPLPNLDYKIMQGNSLLESYKGVDLSRLTETDANELGFGTDEIADLVKAIDGYYTPNDQVAKNKIRKTIQDKVIALLKAKGFAKEKDFYEQLSKIDLHANSEFFLWHTWFGDVFGLDVGRELDIRSETLKSNDYRLKSRNGFDIVIGNPPYIKEYENRHAFDGFRETSSYYMSKMDLWYGFACHGIDLLKPHGILCFIAQNNWTTSSGAKKLRKKVINDTQIKQLLDFNTYMVFARDGKGPKIQTMIMMFEKDSKTNNYCFDYRKLEKDSKFNDMLDLLARNKTDMTYFLNPKFTREEYEGKLLTFSENDVSALLDKIAASSIYLTDDEVTQGIIGNPDDAFKVDDSDLNSFDSDEKKFIHKFHTHTEKYEIDDTNVNIIYLSYKENPNFNINKYPNIKKKLSPYINELKNRREVLRGRFSWFFLHWPRKEQTFKKGFEKIVTQVRCEKPKFCYTTEEYYGSRALFFIQTSRWNMKFLTGVLNSKIVEFWLRGKGKIQGKQLKLDKEPLMNIPIPSATSAQQKPIIALVDKILVAKKADAEADTAGLEAEIDRLVYQLYGLTDEEIRIVEGR